MQKKAMKEYAAYPELKERGFNLDMLDNIQSAEDLYNVLLPFMVIDGVPLDNYISFNGFKFNYHKTVYFTDDYGTITELMAKGYKPEQLFYYPSAGEEKYRAGNYVWEPDHDISSIWLDVFHYKRPFMGKNVAYFCCACFSKDFFKPYIKEIKSKNAIVLDCRLNNNGWGGQIYELGKSLCSANYKGKVILIIDRTTGSNIEYEIINNLRNSYYINESNKNVSFEWIVVGENTRGMINYVYNPKWNYKIGELEFNPLPVEKNKWSVCNEGEGIEPYIWAQGDDDINKTIELLTGETDFAELIKDVTVWRNFICEGDKQLWNWPLKLPATYTKIKSNDDYNASVSKLIAATIEFKKAVGNQEELNNLPWYYDFPKSAEKVKKLMNLKQPISNT